MKIFDCFVINSFLLDRTSGGCIFNHLIDIYHVIFVYIWFTCDRHFRVRINSNPNWYLRYFIQDNITCSPALPARNRGQLKMEQIMAVLQGFHTSACKPCFTHTRDDYLSQLNVNRGRAVLKRWGAIFTCFNSRAVHLELATSLESDCFINVLMRFMNWRGPPKCIYSDNRTNFIVAERWIRGASDNWNQKEIQDKLLQKGCQ